MSHRVEVSFGGVVRRNLGAGWGCQSGISARGGGPEAAAAMQSMASMLAVDSDAGLGDGDGPRGMLRGARAGRASACRLAQRLSRTEPRSAVSSPSWRDRAALWIALAASRMTSFPLARANSAVASARMATEAAWRGRWACVVLGSVGRCGGEIGCVGVCCRSRSLAASSADPRATVLLSAAVLWRRLRRVLDVGTISPASRAYASTDEWVGGNIVVSCFGRIVLRRSCSPRSCRLAAGFVGCCR